ncbi:unnamed protein product [Sphagnum tenellum]
MEFNSNAEYLKAFPPSLNRRVTEQNSTTPPEIITQSIGQNSQKSADDQSASPHSYVTRVDKILPKDMIAEIAAPLGDTSPMLWSQICMDIPEIDEAPVAQEDEAFTLVTTREKVQISQHHHELAACNPKFLVNNIEETLDTQESIPEVVVMADIMEETLPSSDETSRTVEHMMNVELWSQACMEIPAIPNTDQVAAVEGTIVNTHTNDVIEGAVIEHQVTDMEVTELELEVMLFENAEPGPVYELTKNLDDAPANHNLEPEIMPQRSEEPPPRMVQDGRVEALGVLVAHGAS